VVGFGVCGGNSSSKAFGQAEGKKRKKVNGSGRTKNKFLGAKLNYIMNEHGLTFALIRANNNIEKKNRTLNMFAFTT
jgi:aminoglycoside N3'-acetyltransferase